MYVYYESIYMILAQVHILSSYAGGRFNIADQKLYSAKNLLHICLSMYKTRVSQLT